MKKIAAAMVLGCVALAISGCSGSPEDEYVAAVRERAPQVLDGGTEDDLTELGAVICERLDDGTSPYDIADDFVEIGWSLGDSGVVVVEAAQHLCPEHADTVS